ncbi:uncharacterized protein METZ01_LOCUS195027, partial [marine metagenome]
LQEIAFFIINDYLHYAVYIGVFITIGAALGNTKYPIFHSIAPPSSGVFCL